jgi:hypothetical protein
MLIAAGAARVQDWAASLTPAKARVLRTTQWSLLALGAVVLVPLSKPIAPVNSALWKAATGISDNFSEMIGWPEMAEQVAEIVASLPEEELPRTAILAGNYGEAAAMVFYGPRYHLPPMITGSNSMWARGYGDPAPETLVVVGFERPYADRFFKSCQMAGRVSNAYNVKNEETSRHSFIYICREPRRPWPELWQDMQWYQ